jgi:hypothetical protein
MKFRKFAPLFMPAMLVCALQERSSAATATFTPTRDATIFSVATTGANGAGSSMFVGQNGLGENRRALVAFDLTTIPANATVTNVTLQLVCTRVGGVGSSQSLGLQKISASWTEGPSAGSGLGAGQATVPAASNDVTWAQRSVPGTNWTSAGGDFSATVSATQNVALPATYTWGSSAQMVADVQSWVATPANNFGWIVRGGESTASSAKEFSTREDIVANRPLLTVTYTPASGVSDWSMY